MSAAVTGTVIEIAAGKPDNVLKHAATPLWPERGASVARARPGNDASRHREFSEHKQRGVLVHMVDAEPAAVARLRLYLRPQARTIMFVALLLLACSRSPRLRYGWWYKVHAKILAPGRGARGRGAAVSLQNVRRPAASDGIGVVAAAVAFADAALGSASVSRLSTCSR